MKKLLTILAAAVAFAAIAADTDCGAIITTGNIADSAKVENLTGANAGKATVTINDNSGTANSVTVYNVSTMDTALQGKASTSDVTALQTRATALENATNNLATAIANEAESSVHNGDEEMVLYAPGRQGTLGGDHEAIYSATGVKHGKSSASVKYELIYPDASGTFAIASDITNTVPAWARNSTKPSYNFSELGNKPTTISGYGITDANIENGTITLGSNSITPLTSYTETDPKWTADKSSYSTTAQMNTAITSATNGLAKASDLSGYVPTSRKVAGKALTADVTLSNLSIVGSTTTTYNGSATASVNQTTATQTSTTSGGTTGKNLTLAVAATSLDMGAYYIKIGSDGKPHLMLRQ